MTENISFFVPLSKIDKEKRIVSGYASTPTKDLDGEVVTLDAVKKALPGYMSWRNIREMHRLSAVGTAEEAHVDKVGLFLSAKIVDDEAWKKCTEGVYKGFSIGGRKLAKTGDTITEIELTEISIVDRPANPDARFALAKAAGEPGGEVAFLMLAKEKKSPEEKAAKALAKAAEALNKKVPSGANAMNPPAARDGLSLPANKPGQKDPVSDKDQVPDAGMAHKDGGLPGPGNPGEEPFEPRSVEQKNRKKLKKERKRAAKAAAKLAAKKAAEVEFTKTLELGYKPPSGPAFLTLKKSSKGFAEFGEPAFLTLRKSGGRRSSQTL